MKRAGAAVVGVIVLAAVLAPYLSPHAPEAARGDLLNAPPTAVHIRDDAGAWHRPFIYGWRLENRLEQRYGQDRSRPVPLAWFGDGRLVRSSDDSAAPLLLLGADSFGRDVFSRLLHGARTSLAVAFAATLGAMLLGAVLGGVAGYAGGFWDDALMRSTDLVMVLPAIYIALALRSVLPLVLPASTIFLLLVGIFAVVGSPFIARGVRAIVRTESSLDYAAAAVASGAGRLRVLVRHLLPAAAGFIAVEVTLLVPGFIVAEATLSYIGLGFPEPAASWGTMLHDAANIHALADFPWLLSPAVAIFAIVLALNVALQDHGAGVESVR